MTARILQITDPHVVAPPRRVAGRLDTARALQEAVARIDQGWAGIAPIDAIVVTGDISDDGEADSLETFRAAMRPLRAPLLVVPGNHDRRESMRASFADAGYMPPVGRLNWVRELDELTLIGLDTLVEGQGGGVLDAETLAFVRAALSEAGTRPVLIAMHHPPFASGIAFMDAIGLDGSAALADCLTEARGEVRIVCGHVHSTIAASVAGRVALSSAAICSAFSADYRPDAPVGFLAQPGGYMVHTWDDGFRSAAVSLAEAQGPYPFA